MPGVSMSGLGDFAGRKYDAIVATVEQLPTTSYYDSNETLSSSMCICNRAATKKNGLPIA